MMVGFVDGRSEIQIEYNNGSIKSTPRVRRESSLPSPTRRLSTEQEEVTSLKRYSSLIVSTSTQQSFDQRSIGTAITYDSPPSQSIPPFKFVPPSSKSATPGCLPFTPSPGLAIYSQPSVSSPNLTEFNTVEMQNEIIEPRSASADEREGAYFDEPAEERRYHALLELLETERSYLESLRILVKVYFHALPSLNLLTVDEIEKVRRNGEALLSLHEQIATRIQQAEEETSWRERETVGMLARDGMVRAVSGKVAVILHKFLPTFEIYAEFCSKHFEALTIIRGLENRPEWDALERQCSFHATNGSTSTSGQSTPLANQSSPASTLGSKSSLNFESTNFLPFTSQKTLSTSTSMSSLITASIQASKLRFQDYAIRPVQMICRYPLMLGQVLKNWGDCSERKEVLRAWDGLRTVAEGVDEAKKRREGELRTKLVAARLEFQSSINTAFCDILGPTLLVGSLHVLHRWNVPDQVRTKYYGCFLYNSHIVMVKVKKREVYEPREWLPLRLVDILDLSDVDATLPFSIRLSYHHDHYFDLSATCPGEKLVWIEALLTAQTVARQVWSTQPRKFDGTPSLFDGNTISSIPFTQSFPSTPTTPSSSTPAMANILKRHSRSKSSQSMSAALDVYQRELDPQATYDLASLSSAATSPATTIVPLLPVPSKTRVSISQKVTIDARLSDVFSQSLLAARAQGVRENERFGSSSPSRTRTTSTPKRSSSTVETLSRISLKDMRRMSEPRRGREVIEVDQNGFILDRVVTPSAGKLIKRSKTLASPARKKEDLAPIDTKMTARLARRSSGFPILRGVGPSSFEVVASPTGSTSLELPILETGATSPSESTTSVDRNNSVSSNNSSVTTTASSPYFQAKETVETESPNSSLACSPTRECFEDNEPRRWTEVSEPIGRTSKRSASTSSPMRPPKVLTRSNTVNYFKTRVKSSPILSSYFGQGTIQPTIVAAKEAVRPSTPIYDALASPQTSPVTNRVGQFPRRATEPVIIAPPTRRNSFRNMFSKLAITPMPPRQE